ncbi:MAG: phosphatidate cytidylyltransferase [Frankiaceae bacterium]|nr:phosphatidate cytidylyltransferase [Frankiaceae bacterium]
MPIYPADASPVVLDAAPLGRHSRAEPTAPPADGAAEPGAAPRRAGRNLPAAIGVGAGLAAVVVGSLAVRREAFLALVLIAVIYACVELRQAMRAGGISLPRAPLIVGGAGLDVAAWARGPDGMVVALLLTFVGIAAWRLGDGPAGYARDVGAGAFVALYVPFLAGFAVLLAHPPDGAGRTVAFVLTVVCSDVGGYGVGVLIGRHPMAPTISPKKSWEGFGGSLAACAIAGSALFALLFHHVWWIGALYGLAITASATLGDLGESMLKRGIGIKDMGRLLPGHGGLMDRLDSLLPSAAIAYLFLSFVLG